MQLRTVPEALGYLHARRTLPLAALHTIGDEKPLFELYLMNGGNLNGCTGHAGAKLTVETHADQVEEALARNAEYSYHSGLMEHVADCLAARDPDYAHGLTERCSRCTIRT